MNFFAKDTLFQITSHIHTYRILEIFYPNKNLLASCEANNSVVDVMTPVNVAISVPMEKYTRELDPP